MTLRPLFGPLHRWVGLLIAGFLFVSGATGAVISWDAEIDALLNRDMVMTSSTGPAIDSFALARRIEARYPQVQVTEVLFRPDEPGYALGFGVSPRVNPATGKLYEPGFNSVYMDPVTGRETGKRDWGAVWPIDRTNLVSFLYVLHYSLHMPEMWGIDRWGLWLLGGVAMLWTLDCFVGFYLTLPPRRRGAVAEPRASWWRRWKPAWRVRWSHGSHKRNFDLHRAFSLWTWALLLIVAFTAFSLNLYREVFYPAMSLVSNVTPTPFDQRTPTDKHHPIPATVSFQRALAVAQTGAAARGWTDPPSEMYYARDYGIYGVSYPKAGEGHDGVAGGGSRALYVDGRDGRILGDHRPWTGTAADIFVQAQFPLHSGRILGVPGRVLSSLMGLVVATLSVTGVLIWWRKRRARRARERKLRPAAVPAPQLQPAE